VVVARQAAGAYTERVPQGTTDPSTSGLGLVRDRKRFLRRDTKIGGRGGGGTTGWGVPRITVCAENLVGSTVRCVPLAE